MADNKGTKGFESLYDIFSNKLLHKKVCIEDDDVKEILRQMTLALIKGDVDVKLVKEFKSNVESELAAIIAENPIQKKHRSKDVKIHIIKSLCKMITPANATSESILPKVTLHKAATNIHSDIPEKDNFQSSAVSRSVLDSTLPRVILFIGLQGSGKTTTVAKYAKYHKLKGFKVGCICADTFRAGAYEQLKSNCTKAGVYFYGMPSECNPDVIIKNGIEKFTADGFDMIIIDSAGRNKQCDDLKYEMDKIVSVSNPDDTFLVLSSDIGQAAKEQCLFFKQFGVNGIILTKMDSGTFVKVSKTSYGGGTPYSRGGCALVAVAVTGSPVKFIGTGESMNDIEPFDPKSYISRLLGYGDIKHLFEKIQLTDPTFSDRSQKLAKNILSGRGKFTFRDFINHIVLILDLLGEDQDLSKLTSYLPGMKKLMGNNHTSGDMVKKMKNSVIICDSMHSSELDNDDRFLLENPSRISRICRGAGRSEIEMKEVIKLFGPIRDIMENLKKMPKSVRDSIRNGNVDNINNQDLESTLMNMIPGKHRGNSKVVRSQLRGLMGGAFGKNTFGKSMQNNF